MIDYWVRTSFAIDVGFTVSARQVAEAAELANRILEDLPASLYKSLDFKTTSAIVGSVFCDGLASRLKGGIVNPIEKGHPDIIPEEGATASEEELRHYPKGLEVKCTVGNVEQGANLRAGVERVEKITGVTWQAHHREVKELMGLVWDFAQATEKFRYPGITGVFYATELDVADWGEISGTTGRNTKVCGMRTSGKQKMGNGWVMLIDEPRYLERYARALGFALPDRR